VAVSGWWLIGNLFSWRVSERGANSGQPYRLTLFTELALRNTRELGSVVGWATCSAAFITI